MFEPKTDQQLIEEARRIGWPIVHIPCDTAVGLQVATVDLRDPDRPAVKRQDYIVSVGQAWR